MHTRVLVDLSLGVEFDYIFVSAQRRRGEMEENMTTFDKVKDIIVDSLSCDEEQVTLEASLKDDLDADSLDAVELIMAVEDEFDVQIPDEEANKMATVKDIVDYLEANA